MKEYNWNDREREIAADILDKMTECVQIQKQINDLVDITTITNYKKADLFTPSSSSSSPPSIYNSDYMESFISSVMGGKAPRNNTAEKTFNEMFSVALVLDEDDEKGFINVLNDIEQECSIRILLLKKEEYLIREKIGELQRELLSEE